MRAKSGTSLEREIKTRSRRDLVFTHIQQLVSATLSLEKILLKNLEKRERQRSRGGEGKREKKQASKQINSSPHASNNNPA